MLKKLCVVGVSALSRLPQAFVHSQLVAALHIKGGGAASLTQMCNVNIEREHLAKTAQLY